MSERGEAMLSRQLSLVFVVLLLVCCGTSAWLQLRPSGRHKQKAIQRLSNGLTTHIAENAKLMRPERSDPVAVKDLFDKLMAMDPSVEVYLLSPNGHIATRATPPGHLRRNHVDLAPMHRLLANAAVPVLGDDPRNLQTPKVFSAALIRADDQDAGYVYVALQGEDRDAIAAHVAVDNVLQTTLQSIELMILFGLVAGATTFWLITRPLRELTAVVRCFGFRRIRSLESQTATLECTTHGDGEIAVLNRAFVQMTRCIAEQWQELTLQSQQCRGLAANISHDLRMPLILLHSYLETLRLKADTLDDKERRHYLNIALNQNHRVGRFAQELFELARFEYDVVKPERENFALTNLVQDVFQKFELAVGARQQQLKPDITPGLPIVSTDLGIVERMLTDLLDDAICHTPVGGTAEVQLHPTDTRVAVQISGTGPGIPDKLQRRFFVRPVLMSGARSDSSCSGGFELMIVQRILQLYDSGIRLVPQLGKGAVPCFQLTGTISG